MIDSGTKLNHKFVILSQISHVSHKDSNFPLYFLFIFSFADPWSVIIFWILFSDVVFLSMSK